jgi:hypothetical protein
MNCPRCDSKRQIISEYYEFNDSCLVRDEYCSECKSVEVFYFYTNGEMTSDWMIL